MSDSNGFEALPDDLASFTVKVLKGWLAERALKVSGRKADLIARLEAWRAEHAGAQHSDFQQQQKRGILMHCMAADDSAAASDADGEFRLPVRKKKMKM